MLEQLFLRYLSVSFTTSVFVIILYIARPCINQIYVSKWKYYLWFFMAVRLIVPVIFYLPNIPVKVPLSNTGTANFNIVLPASDEPTNKNRTELQAQRNSYIIKTKELTLLEKLFVIWIIGICIFLIFQLIKYYIVKKSIFRWAQISKNQVISKKLSEVSNELDIRKKIPVFVSGKATSPLMIGFLRPIMVLPHENFENLELSFIIRHEILHYKRKDLLYKVVILIANAIHWFNPVIYLMHQQSNTDIELSCDDMVLSNMSFECRKTYSNMIFNMIKHQKSSGLTVNFFGGARVMKERFQNILNVHKKHTGWLAFACLCTISIFVNSFVSFMPDARQSDTSIATVNVDENSNRERRENLSNDVNNDINMESIITFSKNFINLFNGAVASQAIVSFEDYITNKNLLIFVNRMLELTIKQELLGYNDIIYGENNKFGNIECNEITEDVYYLKIPFNFQGSGMVCQLLVQNRKEYMEIADFYFGTKDGVDTIATGHIMERKVNNAELWNDKHWVSNVFEKMLTYNAKLEKLSKNKKK